MAYSEVLADLSRATDGNDNPLSGAVWYFYATGTTTPQAVYADADLSTSLGATVTADSGGKFASIYFDGSKEYRGIIKDSGGSTIKDIDPINKLDPLSELASTSSTKGAYLVGFKQSGTGAIDRTMLAKAREAVSIEDFGGVGDGTTDCSAAMLAAITTGKPVFVPKGNFAVGSIELSTSAHIIGPGKIVGTAAAGSGFRIMANIDYLILDGVIFQDFDYENSAEGSGVFTADTTSITVSKLQVSNCVFENSSGGVFLNCIVQNAICVGNTFKDLTVSNSGIDTAGLWLGTNTYASQNLMKKHIVVGNIFDTITGADEVHGVISYGRETIIADNLFNTINNGALTDCEAVYTKCRWASIENNTFIACDAGDNRGCISVKGAIRGVTSNPQGYAVTVANNRLYSTTGATCGIFIENDDVDVAGNYFEGFGLYAIKTSSVIGGANISIRDNTVRKHRGSVAILSQGYGGNIAVVRNKVYEVLADEGTNAIGGGIQVSINGADTKTVVVNDNIVTDIATSSATTTFRAIRIVTNSSGNISVLECSRNTVNVTRNTTTNIYGISLEFRATINNFVMIDNNLSGVGYGSNTEAINSDATSATYLTSAKVDIRGNSGFGPAYTSAISNIEWYHAGTIFTNTGASGTTTSVLPIAQPGLWFRFVATDNQDFRIDPDGTEVIRGGTAGQYLALDDQGESVTLRCLIAGTWEIEGGYGTYTYA